MLKNGILEAFLSSVNSGFCVRILAGGGIGFASTNKWTKDEAKAIVDLAYRFSKAAKHKDKIKFAEEKAVETTWEVQQKKRIEDIDSETKIKQFLEVDKALTSHTVNVPARVLQAIIVGISKERKHVHWWGEANPPSLAPYRLIENLHITKSK